MIQETKRNYLRMIFNHKPLPLYSHLALVSTLVLAHHWTASALPSCGRAPNEAPVVMLPLRQVRLPKATEQYFDGWLADLLDGFHRGAGGCRHGVREIVAARREKDPIGGRRDRPLHRLRMPPPS